ncbi:MAG: chalcone isomerase family protein [Deltaproteobacteria bacterium]|nr:chalcone isomerase family protein [Deltaproteobacteria bacterium]
MKRLAATVVLSLLSLVAASPAWARECEDVTMPDSVTVDGTRLVLNGMGVREATALQVNVYVAGLYVESRSRDGNAIASSDTRRRLVLHFVRDVSRADIVGAFNEGFGHSGQAGALRAQIRQLTGWMADMHEGEKLTFTYVPSTGLTVQVGRRTRGTIAGAAFAQAFFGIWLGAHPPNAGLRTGLLGGQCG